MENAELLVPSISLQNLKSTFHPKNGVPCTDPASTSPSSFQVYGPGPSHFKAINHFLAHLSPGGKTTICPLPWGDLPQKPACNKATATRTRTKPLYPTPTCLILHCSSLSLAMCFPNLSPTLEVPTSSQALSCFLPFVTCHLLETAFTGSHADGSHRKRSSPPLHSTPCRLPLQILRPINSRGLLFFTSLQSTVGTLICQRHHPSVYVSTKQPKAEGRMLLREEQANLQLRK